MDLRGLRAQPLAQTTPAGHVLDEVVVRLARADERVKWDALMDPHHYPGFTRFAGRGLRCVAEWTMAGAGRVAVWRPQVPSALP